MVFERADRIGGLLRYGIPEFKMEKRHLDRRLDQMEAEGTEFRTGADVGRDVDIDELLATYDAVVLAGGATRVARPADPRPRAAAASTRPWSTCRSPTGCSRATSTRRPITAEGKHVVIIGGGDTGADCLGTAHRQGAASIHQFEIMPRPPDERAATNPWPTWPMMYRTSSAHEEGGERVFSVNTECFLGDDDGNVRGAAGPRGRDGRRPLREGRGHRLRAAVRAGAAGHGLHRPGAGALLEQLGVELDGRGNVARDAVVQTNVTGVFVCGDMGRGQSLIVWAIAEGRSCAAAVDRYLMGETSLPSPIAPTDRPLM